MNAQCLDEAIVAALLDGQLMDAELAEAQQHLATCSQCVAMLADAARGARAYVRGDETRGERGGMVQVREVDLELAQVLRTGASIDGKYRVERLLGHGGMGSVVAARHLELGHSVAIKVLRRAGPGAAARFLREAQTCARLTHPHIVRVFDMGRLPGGTPYLVMEHLEGEDLARVVARGPVPLADALRYVLEACTALEVAHEAGVVHRDLKPANLFLVRRPDRTTTVKVVDFGISKCMASSQSEGPLGLTSTGVMLGSPLYMSPEQLRAAPDVDARTDIWSIGVILHELLTGRPPFRAPTIAALALAIATSTPTPLSRLCPDVPRALELIVSRCLQKEPAQRFASIAALKSALTKVSLPSSDAGARQRSSFALAASWVAVLAFWRGPAAGETAPLQAGYPQASAEALSAPELALASSRKRERLAELHSDATEQDAAIVPTVPVGPPSPQRGYGADSRPPMLLRRVKARLANTPARAVAGSDGSASVPSAVTVVPVVEPAPREQAVTHQPGPLDTPD